MNVQQMQEYMKLRDVVSSLVLQVEQLKAKVEALESQRATLSRKRPEDAKQI